MTDVWHIVNYKTSPPKLECNFKVVVAYFFPKIIKPKLQEQSSETILFQKHILKKMQKVQISNKSEIELIKQKIIIKTLI